MKINKSQDILPFAALEQSINNLRNKYIYAGISACN